MTKDLDKMIAAWIPGWYELDQPIEVGMSAEFAFWRVVPVELRESQRLVFHNDLWHPEEAVVASGTISSITHSELGPIRKIDTQGLDYTIVLADGKEVVVNAEEEPGKIFEFVNGEWVQSSRQVTTWRFIVQFDSLSELKPAASNWRFCPARSAL